MSESSLQTKLRGDVLDGVEGRGGEEQPLQSPQ